MNLGAIAYVLFWPLWIVDLLRDLFSPETPHDGTVE